VVNLWDLLQTLYRTKQHHTNGPLVETGLSVSTHVGLVIGPERKKGSAWAPRVKRISRRRWSGDEQRIDLVSGITHNKKKKKGGREGDLRTEVGDHDVQVEQT
jgi:hypothetical protein